MVKTGETDFTATEISGLLESLISASAMERLRQSAARERAPDDLLRESDRKQVIRLMKELMEENSNIQPPGRGKYARYRFNICK